MLEMFMQNWARCFEGTELGNLIGPDESWDQI